MQQAGGTRRPVAGHRLSGRIVHHVRSHRAGEHPVVPVLVHRTPVAARNYLQWPVLQGHVVQEDQDRNQVVVGVGLVQEVLVEPDGGGRPGLLGVDLGVVELDVGANQLRRSIDHPGIAHHVEVDVGHLDRRGHPPEGGRFGRMARLDVEAGPTVDRGPPRPPMRAAIGDPVGEDLLQGGQVFGCYGVGHHHIAIAVERRHLLVAEYLHHRGSFHVRGPGIYWL